jgi:hypothetical protein
MTKLLLTIHVLAAIIAVGPVAVAASMFPAAVRHAPAAPEDGRDSDATATVRTLHRVCRVYAAVGVVVPVFGLATAGSLHVLGDAWLIVSIALTATAAAVLAVLVLPGQSAIMAALGNTPTSTPTARPLQALRIAARVELVSLTVLLANLATAHWSAVSSVMGPVHGCAYLFVIIATLREAGAPAKAKLAALAPGVGGLLALRQLTRGEEHRAYEAG